MFGREPRRYFTYGERVRIISGFFNGQVGTVIAELAYRLEYTVELDGIAQRVFHNSQLQRLDDDAQPEHIRKIVLETRA